ncbi:SufE family protein [Methylobacterium nodulans]|uniref:Fe-S metabolism associated SufE n=1 Tax=Methylobacterium nodulans (strain LMG 21967 / CNCM I-2342 / ORS 2060) TaxID=460265 RepID=B8IUZ8_METNO|nr:SufE family protein [Methylobacterium nodulans]ACL59056.1 Fe-S metabolism associated SufE [Methylobacterium nodulans ORS 2060]
MLPPIAEIVDNFAFLEEWEDRHQYLMELGRKLPPLPEEARTEANKVRGCVSQVWLETLVDRAGGTPRLHFRGDSDAHITKGVVAVLIAFFDGRPAADAAKADAFGLFQKLGLSEHLTAQRSNGARAMMERMRSDAARVAEAA